MVKMKTAMTSISLPMDNIEGKFLKETSASQIENDRKLLTNYLLIINLVIKLVTIVFMGRLFWLNLYYTVITLTIIVLVNFFITTLYYIYYKKYKQQEEGINLSCCVKTLLLTLSVFRYDKHCFSELKANRIFALKMQLLWHYFYFLPLGLIFIHEFIRLFYLKTVIIMITASTLKIYSVTLTNTFITTTYVTRFDFYFYLLSFMCISSVAIFNVILITRRLANESHQNYEDLVIDRQLFNENNWLFNKYFHVSLLFTFLFRYFLYLARNLSIVLTFISSVAIIKLTSDGSDRVAYTQNKYFYSLFGYLIVSFTSFVFLHFFESFRKNKQLTKLQIITKSFYHAFVMTCDVDEGFFRIKKSKFYTKMKITVFMLLILLSTSLCTIYWYYWYYYSYNYTILDSDSILLLLLSNFSKYKYKILDSFSYEQQLQEEIKFKQIMLVIICGCTLVSLLSFHIYYNYYFNYNFIDLTNLEIFNEFKIVPSTKRAANLVNPAFDSSRDDYYTSTSEISESTYYSQPTTVPSSSSSNVLPTPKQAKNSYDTESGILSTVTSSSCFTSSSYDRQFIDNLVDVLQSKNSKNVDNTSIFTQSNLILHNSQANEANIDQSFYDKVYAWFVKSNSSTDINLQQYKFKSRNSIISQQSTADCSIII